MRKKWEYAIMHYMASEDSLNALGAEGWELVHVGAPDSDGDKFCVFKREVLANDQPVES